MNIAVDYGNTMCKVGIFQGEHLTSRHFFSQAEQLENFLKAADDANLIVSSVSFAPDVITSWHPTKKYSVALTSHTPLPVNILYKTPLTLGVDRIAAVCGALSEYPDSDCLVIDAGSCMTFEFLDAGRNYHGGSISPGVKMRFASMHQFTARLPLAQPIQSPALTGQTTEECLQSGVINGIRAEVKEIVSRYRKHHPDIKILICGGDAEYFENLLNNVIFAPDLVLKGLNRILLYNMSL